MPGCRGPETSAGTEEAAAAFAGALGKQAIRVADSPGFATSRLGLALGLEAMRMIEEGVASAGDIDRAIQDFSKELRQNLGEVLARVCLRDDLCADRMQPLVAVGVVEVPVGVDQMRDGLRAEIGKNLAELGTRHANAGIDEHFAIRARQNGDVPP